MNQVKSKDSNSKQGSELLEAVGGLEAAQAIIDNAPEGATHFSPQSAVFLQQVSKDDFDVFVSTHDWRPFKSYGNELLIADLSAAITGQDCSSKPSTNLYPFCTLCNCWDGGPQCNCEPQIPVCPDEAEFLPAPSDAANVPEDDTTELTKLHATQISIYAARISKQNTIITIFGAIIGFLVFVCIGLLLWGLK